MPPPAPPIALEGHCSVIHDDILYVFSPEAFQSLALEKDATWKQEPQGVSVSGAACALGNVDGDHNRPALFVVGGATNSSQSEYPGLQRFSFGDRKWDSITPVVRVTQNRQHHGAAALNASSSILVYGGSQDGDSNPSTQTFIIEMFPPYSVRSFNSLAPPVVEPQMLTWDTNRAAMIGGSATNTQVFTFGPDDGWADSGVALQQAPPPRSISQSTLLTLADQSKVLFTFDFSQSPNTVIRTVILNPGGAPAPFGSTIGDAQPSRRDITLDNFPQYNDSQAPSATRNGASLAQGVDGTMIITGGNGEEPIAIFNGQENTWEDPTALIGNQPQQPLTSSVRSTSSTPTATVSSSPTPEPAAAGPSLPGRTILGAVLGSICGVIFLLIFLLLLLRWRKKRNCKDSSEFPNDKRKHSRLSFEDQGIPIRPAAQPMGRSMAPSADDMTRVGDRGTHTRNVSSISSRFRLEPHRSSNVSFGPGMFSQKKSPLAISKPIPHQDAAEVQARPSTSSSRAIPNHIPLDRVMNHRKDDSQGWSTYFAGNPAAEKRQTVDSRASHISSGSRGSYWPDPAAPIAKLRAPGLTDSHGNQLAAKNVATGSPTVGHSGAGHGVAIREGIPAKISNTDSIITTGTGDYDDKNVGSAYPSSQPMTDQWNFLDVTQTGPRSDRHTSSNYTNSMQPFASTTDRTKAAAARPITQWPNDHPNSRPSTAKSAGPSTYNRPTDSASREPRDFFGSNQRPSHHHRDPSNDMSWLNLNGGNGHPNTGSGTANN